MEETIISSPNELGYCKVSIRKGDEYREGIRGPDGKLVIEPTTQLLVNDISGTLALVQFERKFLFVPLDIGEITKVELEEVNGFQYATPYSCGVSLAVLDDRWFYINRRGERAFESDFDFGETFHLDRALVKNETGFQIIDPTGAVIKLLEYEQVNLQSAYYWQVSQRDGDRYRHRFIGLDGELLSERDYEEVGYYDEKVKRLWIKREGKFGFLDDRGHEIIPPRFDYAEVFDKGKAKVMSEERVFFIDPDGNEVSE